MARTKATYRCSQARQRQRDARRATVSGEPSTTSVTAATSTNSPSVAGASAENNTDKNAAATLATNQPSDNENGKEMTNQPIVDSTTAVRETNVEND